MVLLLSFESNEVPLYVGVVDDVDYLKFMLVTTGTKINYDKINKKHLRNTLDFKYD